MTFGKALEELKKGKKVARSGWNGKGMWLWLISSKNYIVCEGPNSSKKFKVMDKVKYVLPWIGMKTADDGFVPWLASQSDMLGDDWEIVK